MVSIPVFRSKELFNRSIGQIVHLLIHLESIRLAEGPESPHRPHRQTAFVTSRRIIPQDTAPWAHCTDPEARHDQNTLLWIPPKKKKKKV